MVFNKNKYYFIIFKLTTKPATFCQSHTFICHNFDRWFLKQLKVCNECRYGKIKQNPQNIFENYVSFGNPMQPKVILREMGRMLCPPSPKVCNEISKRRVELYYRERKRTIAGA